MKNQSKKNVDIVAMRGGIDKASTYIGMDPGAARDLLNFEPELEGGYTRVAGYERIGMFNGVRPSDAVYYTLEVEDGLVVPVDSDITGETSGATARVIARDGNTLGITNLAGSFESGESIGATTAVLPEVVRGLDDMRLDAEWKYLAEQFYRAHLGPVPGEGPVLGTFFFGQSVYAIRAKTIGGPAGMWVGTGDAWHETTFGHELLFVDGVMEEGEITDGVEIVGATSGATATVKRFVKNEGSYESDASGYMTLADLVGVFEHGEGIEVGGVTKAVAGGDSESISLSAFPYPEQLRYLAFKTITHRFPDSSTPRIYGVGSLNEPFEFDGATLTFIRMPLPDYFFPELIVDLVAFRDHLFLASQSGEIFYSAPGLPLVFDPMQGAGSFSVGSPVTGMVERAGGVLAIYTKDHTYGLYGTSADNWELRLISESFGGQERTVQKMGTVYALGQEGISTIDRVEAFGDFESATVSRPIKPILDSYHWYEVVGSLTVKKKNQYRLFYNDGTVLIMVNDSSVNQSTFAFSLMKIPHTPTVVYSGEDNLRDEVVLFGDVDGFVYQMERGNNFDGLPIEYVYRSPNLHQKTPHTRKAYRRIFLEMEVDALVNLSVATEMSFSAPGSAVSGSGIAIMGGGGFFNEADWNSIYWDAETFASHGIALTGIGNNISVVIYGNDAITRQFTLQSLEIHYLLRRLRRGK